MGIDLVDLMKESDSKWKESVHSDHLMYVFTFILGYISKGSTISIKTQNTRARKFSEERNSLIKDFFSQNSFKLWRERYATSEATGLIYNKVLDYENSDNLFTLCRSIISSLKKYGVKMKTFLWHFVQFLKK